MENLKENSKLVFIILLTVLFVWFLTRPCSVRPFQDKGCFECGMKEGEDKAIEDWNKSHTKDYQVDIKTGHLK